MNPFLSCLLSCVVSLGSTHPTIWISSDAFGRALNERSVAGRARVKLECDCPSIPHLSAVFGAGIGLMKKGTDLPHDAQRLKHSKVIRGNAA
ncbi:MAG: hypothetical protein KJ000_13325 [Pirellulaceae bacterium]|nr:hypothetical protein [Pirellulaceae bacterium]